MALCRSRFTFERASVGLMIYLFLTAWYAKPWAVCDGACTVSVRCPQKAASAVSLLLVARSGVIDHRVPWFWHAHGAVDQKSLQLDQDICNWPLFDGFLGVSLSSSATGRSSLSLFLGLPPSLVWLVGSTLSFNKPPKTDVMIFH